MNIFKLFFIIIMQVLLFGCSEADNKDIKNADRYIQKNGDIRTYQFIRNYGMGGIYWVSNDSVVFDGVLRNKKGIFEQGVYKVSINGDVEHLAIIDNYIGFEYCFDGNVLHLKNETNNIRIFNNNNAFEIKYGSSRRNSHKNGSRSALRCKFVKWPTSDGYLGFAGK